MARVAVGGTFDPIHDGHIALLRRAFTLGEGGDVVIGLTSDEMARGSRTRAVRDFEVAVGGVEVADARVALPVQRQGQLRREQAILDANIIAMPFQFAGEVLTLELLVLTHVRRGHPRDGARRVPARGLAGAGHRRRRRENRAQAPRCARGQRRRAGRFLQ